MFAADPKKTKAKNLALHYAAVAQAMWEGRAGMGDDFSEWRRTLTTEAAATFSSQTDHERVWAIAKQLNEHVGRTGIALPTHSAKGAVQDDQSLLVHARKDQLLPEWIYQHVWNEGLAAATQPDPLLARREARRARRNARIQYLHNLLEKTEVATSDVSSDEDLQGPPTASPSTRASGAQQLPDSVRLPAMSASSGSGMPPGRSVRNSIQSTGPDAKGWNLLQETWNRGFLPWQAGPQGGPPMGPPGLAGGMGLFHQGYYDPRAYMQPVGQQPSGVQTTRQGFPEVTHEALESDYEMGDTHERTQPRQGRAPQNRRRRSEDSMDRSRERQEARDVNPSGSRHRDPGKLQQRQGVPERDSGREESWNRHHARNDADDDDYRHPRSDRRNSGGARNRVSRSRERPREGSPERQRRQAEEIYHNREEQEDLPDGVLANEATIPPDELPAPELFVATMPERIRSLQDTNVRNYAAIATRREAPMVIEGNDPRWMDPSLSHRQRPNNDYGLLDLTARLIEVDNAYTPNVPEADLLKFKQGRLDLARSIWLDQRWRRDFLSFYWKLQQEVARQQLTTFAADWNLPVSADVSPAFASYNGYYFRTAYRHEFVSSPTTVGEKDEVGPPIRKIRNRVVLSPQMAKYLPDDKDPMDQMPGSAFVPLPRGGYRLQKMENNISYHLALEFMRGNATGGLSESWANTWLTPESHALFTRILNDMPEWVQLFSTKTRRGGAVLDRSVEARHFLQDVFHTMRRCHGWIGLWKMLVMPHMFLVGRHGYRLPAYRWKPMPISPSNPYAFLLYKHQGCPPISAMNTTGPTLRAGESGAGNAKQQQQQRQQSPEDRQTSMDRTDTDGKVSSPEHHEWEGGIDEALQGGQSLDAGKQTRDDGKGGRRQSASEPIKGSSKDRIRHDRDTPFPSVTAGQQVQATAASKDLQNVSNARNNVYVISKQLDCGWFF
eukprot:GHVU01093837.1.p1 GENE.GHVU01093837.1~~GHVU01093837.1.p1  ORF type:complete len:951 (+),score=116.89 GHVU01093837.1:1333-4185(+)